MFADPYTTGNVLIRLWLGFKPGPVHDANRSPLVPPLSSSSSSMARKRGRTKEQLLESLALGG
jgi:hypothetical protein